MSVRVRFAPSPTGHLHIGGARTALYNYLFAKAQKGTFIVRIEDTDRERSTKEYEESVLADLKWLGLEWDEGPDKNKGYRQSERTELYQKHADQFINQGKAFYCFCTDEELLVKKEKAKINNLDPRYDGKCRDITKEEAIKRIEAGEKATIRFKVPAKSYKFFDHVRKDVEFPEGMVGDFVIMRSTGLPVYNYCCAIDDWDMKITHVLRAEDHLANTLRQLMIYEAVGATPPEFVHVSLLIGKDRQKLSKRHGATSVTNYREDSYLADALNNYLCMLGWSHPDEKDIFTMKEIEPLFGLSRFTKASAVFDIDKFHWVNEQHLKNLSAEEIIDQVEKYLPTDSLFRSQTMEWRRGAIDLFREKMQCFADLNQYIEELFDSSIDKDEALNEILSWETTPQIKEYFHEQLKNVSTEFITVHEFDSWSNYVKKELKIKGKPLFMGMRGVLTGKAHGSDLKQLIPLTPVKVIFKRIEQL